MAEERICIYKLPMEKITEHGNSIDGYTDEQAIMCGELVPISTSQLTGKIYDYYNENGLDGLTICMGRNARLFDRGALLRHHPGRTWRELQRFQMECLCWTV